MLHPLVFHPILKPRVWGGRNLQRLYGKTLTSESPIGESWEISDRPGDDSVVAHGPLAGKTLHWLMEHHERAMLGTAAAADGRFPLLLKILDAQDVLSVQVHPPATAAAALHGEPKTEFWYFTDTTPEACVYAGLKAGVSRSQFEAALQTGTVAECLHRIPTASGDALFLPSGRVHAIGSGNVLFEIQQNSDTTYRVFDWNRHGLDGAPRELHVPESMASIDFHDFEPSLVPSRYSRNQNLKVRFLLRNPLFMVDACQARRGLHFYLRSDAYQVLAVVQGQLAVGHGDFELPLGPGQFCLLPAGLDRVRLHALRRSEFLHIQPGHEL